MNNEYTKKFNFEEATTVSGCVLIWLGSLIMCIGEAIIIAANVCEEAEPMAVNAVKRLLNFLFGGLVMCIVIVVTKGVYQAGVIGKAAWRGMKALAKVAFAVPIALTDKLSEFGKLVGGFASRVGELMSRIGKLVGKVASFLGRVKNLLVKRKTVIMVGDEEIEAVAGEVLEIGVAEPLLIECADFDKLNGEVSIFDIDGINFDE